MPSYRIGFGSEFALKDRKIGVGTDNPTTELDIIGNINAGGVTGTGVGTFVRYSGFFPDEVTGDVTFTGEHQTSGDIVVGVGETFTVSVGATVNVGRVESITIGNSFSLPVGDINDRPEAPVEGTVRFNEDLNTVEFYNGVEWRQFNVSGTSGRGIFGGGQPAIGAGTEDPIQYIQIQSKGNSQFFGELASTGHGAANTSCCSSSTRGLFNGGSSPNTSYMNVIEYITIASSGNGINFGDLTTRVAYHTSTSSSTRGVFMGGYVGQPSQYTSNTICYVEISTLGDAKDFGDLQNKSYSPAGASNGVRGMYAGGTYEPYNAFSNIESFNIASTGNASNFGDLTEQRYGPSGSSNRTRMIVAGGRNESVATKSIDCITMASEGNAVDFGSMTIDKERGCSVASQTRCVFAAGDRHPASGATNTIEFIEIATGGNAEDFGDMMTETQYAMGSCSDSHGGLGGY